MNGFNETRKDDAYDKRVELHCHRGIVFLPPDIEKSDPNNYIPEDGNIRIPL